MISVARSESVFFEPIAQKQPDVLFKQTWAFRCSKCGAESVFVFSRVMRGQVRCPACGFGPDVIKDGSRNGPEFNTWVSMMQRCYNPGCDVYNKYGGRGVEVDRRWWVFDNFLSDMGRRPDGCKFERIKADQNYDIYNCRWVTKRQRSGSNRSTVRCVYRGHEISVSDLSDISNIPVSRLRYRIKSGMTADEAVSVPVSKATIMYKNRAWPAVDLAAHLGISYGVLMNRIYRGHADDAAVSKRNVREKKIFLYNGEFMSIKHISEISGIKYGTIKTRLYSGWSVEKSITTPPGKGGKRIATMGSQITHNGLTMNLTKWARHVGINQGTLSSRIRSGIPFSEAIVP